MFENQELSLLCDAVSRAGTFDPDEVLPRLESALSINTLSDMFDFLSWVDDTGRTFGRGNISDVLGSWLGNLS